ncbi:MAG: 50S ribosomal protein L10 [Deltaproteobacteria bacterium]|nr:50S ribosomal protein L10 [Deltaproteobacteria bacterium]
MLREEKHAEVEQIANRFAAAKAAFIAEYRGLTVAQMTQLRGKIRGVSGGMRVIKNRLALRALQQHPLDGIEQHLVGPTALATATSDPVLLAKVLVEFARECETLKIKGGNVEGRAVSARDIEALAILPSRDVLLSQLLSVMQGPARGVASVLAAVPRGLVTAMKAIGEAKSAS